MEIFTSNAPFELECGGVLPSLRVAYTTYGTLNSTRDNVIWVCHALTASSDVASWWPDTVVDGGFLDPAQWFVVCANKLGSPYGSSSPADGNWGDNFATFRDITHANQLLAAHLGIGRIAKLIGGSTGGMQAMEWAYTEPNRFGALILIATLPRSTAWIVASSAAQRMAIKASDNSKDGLSAARAISMLQYRGATAYNLTQSEPEDAKITDFKVSSYQQYQGEKLSLRFDVACYLALLGALDSHNIGRNRGGVTAALGQITTPTIAIGIDSDIMFPAAEIEAMAAAIPNATYHTIHSDFGHDGFLIETSAITAIII